MSREIDLSEPLSDEDREYMMTRGREAEVEEMDAVEQEPAQPVHTGDVGIDPEGQSPTGLVPQGVPAPALSVAAAAAAAGMPGVVGEESETTPAEGLAPPYSRYTVSQLKAEIERRNALPENDEYEDMSTGGNKAELVDALEQLDES